MEKLVGGARRSEHDDGFWQPVFALMNDAFPGLPKAIDRAAEFGFLWSDVTTPFALFEEGRCVAHASVLFHPMRIGGRDRTVAGVHAVCTAQDRRRQGLSARVLEEALSWLGDQSDLVKLHTDLPAVYESQGFVPVPTWRFRSLATPARGVRVRPFRPLHDDADRAWLERNLPGRARVSERCASADDGWMVGIVSSLSGRLEEGMWYLSDHDAVVVLGDQGEEVTVEEVFGPSLPPADVIAGAASTPRPIFYTFPPDILEPEAQPEPAPASIGVFMVRGRWPLDEPVGISPLWEH